MKNAFEFFAGLVILLFMGVVLWQVINNSNTDETLLSQSDSVDVVKDDDSDNKPVACTMDAKMCSDGSFVGRVGPNCEFSPCPSESKEVVNSFEDCVEAGNPIMESYPRQCNHNGQHFVEDIGGSISEFPLRYGEDASRIEEYRSDCEQRMGVFNECASACGPEAEECVDVCSMVCEGPAEEHVPPMPSDVNPEEVTFCTPEQKQAEVCTMEYMPVCGFTEVQCVTEPCEPVEQTYGNVCGACAGGADYYISGGCAGEGVYAN